jgi:protein phosphatase 1G
VQLSGQLVAHVDMAVALSEDHKPLQESERRRIEAAGGTVNDVGGVARVNSNLNLSRAIGDLKYKLNTSLPPEKQVITAQPDVRIFELTKEDRFFVLACDGIWDVMTNQVCLLSMQVFALLLFQHTCCP